MKSRRSRLLVGLCLLVGAGVLALGAAAVAFYSVILSDLPDLKGVDDYRPALATTVYDRDGNPIGEFFEERRRLVLLDQIPEHVVMAFVAGEDDSFFEHEGIDFRSILRAAWVNLVSGEIEQGASTITQQTVKTLLLTPERKLERKLKEMVLARRVEQHLSKDEILYLYLNQIYFGGGAYGVGEAARTYFGKQVDELTVSEGALLAGLPKAPTRYSPRSNPSAADGRRRYVLGRMHDLGFIDTAQYQEALASQPEIQGPSEKEDMAVAAWFGEEVRRLLFDRLGGEAVLRGGLRVETTLDLDLQYAADSALREGLEALDRRQGWKGRLRRVERAGLAAEAERLGLENGMVFEPEAGARRQRDPDAPLLGVVVSVSDKEQQARVAVAPGNEGVVALEDVAWARPRDLNKRTGPRKKIADVFEVGDVTKFEVLSEADGSQPARFGLHQEPAVEGALVSLDIATGEVIALVGGYDFGRSQFDRAVQAQRQPGSAFKPIIYTTALGRGYTAVSTLYDRPVVYNDPSSGFTWRPENYGRRFLGPLPLREALARSVNNATIHLLRDVGVGPVIETAQRLGIRSPLERSLALGLGASPVSLLELTTAYAVLPNGGRAVEPRFVRRVIDRDGNVLFENAVLNAPAEAQGESADGALASAHADSNGNEPVLDPVQAFLATDLLRAVIEDPKGTGGRARSLGRPLGGKTGTTNDQGDAWFVGFSADIAAGVWVGFDQKQVLGSGETGGRAALPVWIDFMRAAHEDRPPRDFPVPEGVSFARVDRETGKLAGPALQNAYFQAFQTGTEPTETASDDLSATDSRKMLRHDF